MTLTPEQKQSVAAWVAAGDTLSTVQKKLAEQFKVSLTYRDVRFLVDDLGLELKNAAPKADVSDLSKVTPAAVAPQPAPSPYDTESPLPDEDELLPDDLPPGDAHPAPAGPVGALSVEIDRIVRPGAAMSGNVTFSDGVSGKWALDHHGRLMLDTGKPGYQPSPTDVQAFQRELQSQLQRQGY